MSKKLLKITGILVGLFLTMIALAILLFRIYSPDYFIPYVVDQVREETNGRYFLSINSDSVKVRILTMNLHLGHTEFRRDSSVYDNSSIEFLDKFDVHIKFESLKVSSLHLLKFVFYKKIRVEELIVEKPTIVIRKNINFHPDEYIEVKKESIPPSSINYKADSVLADTLAWDEFKVSRGAVTPYIKVDTFRIEKASFTFYDGRKNYPIQAVHGLDVNLSGFVSDEYDDIELEDALLHIDSASTLVSKNHAQLKVKGVNIHPDSVHVDELHFGHIVNPYRINKIKGFRASWLNIEINDIDVSGIHPGELMSDSIVNIDKTSIGFLKLYLFKDKEELIINPAYKALPPEQIRQIPIPVLVDTFEISSGEVMIDMEAPKATKPGRLIIDDLNVQILNITNIPTELKKNPTMKFHALCEIDDAIKVDLRADFDIPSPEDKVHVTCDVKPFPAPTLNGFLGSQFFIEFPTGRINHLHFEFDGNNKANVGTMDMEYENLKIRKLQDYQKFIEGKPKTGFAASIGNILIPTNRSRQSKGYKQAVIYYEKEYNRDFIHGTIMSLVSGIASSVGFSGKNLKKKEEKAVQLDESAAIKSAGKAQKKAKKAEKKKNN